MSVVNSIAIKQNIKSSKFDLANQTEISDGLLACLRSYKIITAADVDLIKQERSSSGHSPAGAYEIYCKLEKSENDKLFKDVVEQLETEGQLELVKQLKDEGNLPRKSKTKRGGGNVPFQLLHALDGESESEAKRRTVEEKTTPVASQVTNSNIFYYFNRRIGSDSTVFHGYVKMPGTDGIDAAVKEIDKTDELRRRELQVWRRLRQENSSASTFLVSLLEMTEEEEEGGKIYLAMSKADRNLHEEVTDKLNPFRDQKKIRCYLENIAKAVEWLHGQNILHRHIKPQNVLIYECRKETLAKLGEFGVSRPMQNSQGSRSVSRGTEEWMAPEALIAKQNDEQHKFVNTKFVDIFVLGMLCHFAITGGEHPFMDKKGVVVPNIRKGDVRPKSLLSCKGMASAENLLQWTMQKDHERRPTVQQILNHPFFWKEERILDFIKAVITESSKKTDAWKAIVERVDTTYKLYYSERNDEKAFTWQSQMHVKFFERKKHFIKKYTEGSFWSLLELIRDKYEHRSDMAEELYNLFTNDKGAFSKAKYVTYFMERFPDLLIILFCTLASIADQSDDNKKCLRNLVVTEEEGEVGYLELFVNCRRFWSDQVVKHFLSLYFVEEM